MTRQQKQRAVVVLVLGLAGMVLARHLLLRGGLPDSVASRSLAAPRLPQGARTFILQAVRAHLETGAEIEVEEMAGEAGQRVVMISLERLRQPALVARGEGPNVRTALSEAAHQLSRRVTQAEIREGRLKIDIATALGARERFNEEGRVRLDRSLEGLWLPEPDLLLLPEELLSRRLVHSDGELNVRRLRDYLAEGSRGERRGREQRLQKDVNREGAPYHVARFDSFMGSEDGELPMKLYRGNNLVADLSPPALLATARNGGEYLLRHQKADGSFGYSYEAKRDVYNDKYNLLRHAGTCYALVELYQATADPRYLEASRRGIEYLLGLVRPPKEIHAAADFEALVSPGEEAKLGGAALAILALVEYQRASADDRFQERATRLARFLLHQQEESGHFHSKYFYGEPDEEPFESIYYPGEAILALLRLHSQDPRQSQPRDDWLAAAQRGADWLIGVRDAGKRIEELPHDHWLLMALNELHAATGEERYAAHAARIAQAILEGQRTSSPYPDWVGSFYDPPRSTPTATRAEGLVAMHRLARRRGDDPRRYREALLLMAAFQRRCQLTTENTLHLPRPDRALGGFRRSLTNWEVRIDYVQHNLSALLGLRTILLEDIESHP